MRSLPVLAFCSFAATAACSSPTSTPAPPPSESIGQPLGVAVDAKTIYVTDGFREAEHTPKVGRVLAIPRAGGDIKVLATTTDLAVDAPIAVDDGFVYYTTQFVPKGGPYTSHLFRVPIAGGEPEELATAPFIQAIALDADRVYFASDGSIGTGAAAGTIQAVAKTGGAAVTLASDAIAPSGLAISGTDVFYTLAGDRDNATGSVVRVPKAGGPTEVLAQNLPWPHAIVAGESAVYWLEYTLVGVDCSPVGDVVKLDLGGGAPVILAGKQPAPTQLALDGATLYWINDGAYCNLPDDSGSIVKMPAAGGASSEIASKVLNPVALAIDSGSVFFLHDADQGGDHGALVIVSN